jgi:hypothetical protein
MKDQDHNHTAPEPNCSKSQFTRIGRTVINADRLLVAGFLSDEDRESADATLRFDNGSQVRLHLDAEASLNELL